jgi:hypothetical protein
MSGLPTAAERLEQSRGRLQAALLPVPGGPDPVPPWLLGALARWWAPHPLHQALVLLRALADAWARPVAARHPTALLGGALAFGAAVALARPWRWLAWPTLLAGLGPALWREWVRRPPR